MYEDTARVHFAGTSKKSEMLYILWFNIGGAKHFITVAKSKMYCMGVKSTASGLTFHTKNSPFYSLTIHFNFGNCNKCIRRRRKKLNLYEKVKYIFFWSDILQKSFYKSKNYNNKKRLKCLTDHPAEIKVLVG